MIGKTVKMTPLQQKGFDIVFAGFEEYRREIKGQPCPSKADLEDWENFKLRISENLEQGHGTT